MTGPLRTLGVPGHDDVVDGTSVVRSRARGGTDR